MQSTAPTQHARRRAAGFTLVEILISLGIFLIGMTAIVSLFPAAAILQRETTQEVLANMAAESGKAIIDANKLTYVPGATPTGDLGGYHGFAGTNKTDAVPLRTVMGAVGFDALFPASDRSFPTGLVNGANIDNCDLHWVPFIQDLSGDPASPNWIMRLFIVESDSRATYLQGNADDANLNDPTSFPKVRFVAVSSIGDGADTTVTGDTFNLAAATDIEPSDIVMDSNGNDHVVIEVIGNNITVLNKIPLFPKTPTKLWYAPRAGGTNSPAQRVITVEVDVQGP